MKNLFRNTCIVAFLSLLAMSCNEEVALQEEVKAAEGNTVAESPSISESELNWQQARFQELIRIMNEKEGTKVEKEVLDTDLADDKATLSNYNSYSFNLGSSTYARKSMRSGTRGAEITQFASMAIKTEFFGDRRGSFSMRLNGTKQTMVFDFNRIVDFSPSWGAYELLPRLPYSWYSANVTTNKPINIRAYSTPPMTIDIHSNTNGYMAVWIKVDGVLKYEALGRFHYQANTDSGLELTYSSDKGKSDHDVVVNGGWF